MQAFKQAIKQSLPLFFIIALFSSVYPVFAETTETGETHHAQNKDWQGMYLGFLPCDGCKGVKTTLALNANHSYMLITQYVGKSDKETVEKGKFTWGSQEHRIVLTSRNGATTRHYLIGEKMLIQLDNNGNEISGDLAKRYILRKNEITEPSASSHSGH